MTTDTTITPDAAQVILSEHLDEKIGVHAFQDSEAEDGAPNFIDLTGKLLVAPEDDVSVAGSLYWLATQGHRINLTTLLAEARRIEHGTWNGSERVIVHLADDVHLMVEWVPEDPG